MRRLGIRYHDVGKSNPYYVLDWPSNSPLVWASVSPEPGSNLSEAVGRRLVKASILPGYRVFFAVATEQNNDYLKSLLSSKAELFQEIREKRGKKTLGRNLFEFLTFGRRAPVVVSTLLASTSQTSVIDAVFARYSWFWKTYFVFPFVVASSEPRDWAQELAALSKSDAPRKISANMIHDSRCIIFTRWDHGFSFVSDKVKRAELESILQQIAVENNLQLSISEKADSSPHPERE